MVESAFAESYKESRTEGLSSVSSEIQTEILTSESFGSTDGSNGSVLALQKAKKAKKASSKKKITGFVFKKSGLYYYQKGKKLKKAWKKVNGKKYYFNKEGKAVKGIKRISGILYLFNGNYALQRSKGNRFLERNGHMYYVTKKGQVLTDWQYIGGQLYHFSKRGRMDVNKKVDRVKLNENGSAIKSKEAKAKINALKILNKISSKHDTRKKKLWAAWQYLISHRHFSYASIYPQLNKKNWQYDTANLMLEGRRGNCYSFACAFSAFAQVIGYEPTLVLGRIHGSRDGARDGFTRHSWVKIGNKYYDPELRFSGSAHIYGTYGYPCSAKNVRYLKF